VGSVALGVYACVVKGVRDVLADAQKACRVGPHAAAEQLAEQEGVTCVHGLHNTADILPKGVSLTQA
jgi:hypothetical protein